jgi:hypothetical protein
MRKALVEPSGRIAQVEDVNLDPESGGVPFPVAEPLRWVDCEDATKEQTHHFNGSAVVENEPPPPPTKEEMLARIDAESGMDRGEREIAIKMLPPQSARRQRAEKAEAAIAELGIRKS